MLFLKSCKGTKIALGSKKLKKWSRIHIFSMLTWHKFLGGLFSRVDSGCSWLIPPFHRLCRWSFHRPLPGGSTNSSDSQTSCHTDCTGRALAFHSCLSDKTAQQSHSSRNLRQGREWKAEPCFRDLYRAPPERETLDQSWLWEAFMWRARLLRVDSTFPHSWQVVFPSCTAAWFVKLW